MTSTGNHARRAFPTGPALRRMVALRLKQLRAARGLTQDELAERAGVSVDTVRRIERAVMAPTLDVIGKLCAGLALSLPVFFMDLGGGRSTALAELCDALGALRNDELRRAMRVLRALAREPD